MVRLRRVRIDAPGWSRRRAGRGFVYLDLDKVRIVDEEHLERITALAIPPAWRDVWISPWPNGHIQAAGLDDAERRQYLYHQQWRVRRDRLKHDHVLDVARRLPAARRRVRADLALDGMPREKVLALAFRLLDLAYLRVGGEGYALQHGSYGLATLLRSHVRVLAPESDGDPGRVHLNFPAKSGQVRDTVVEDDDVATAGADADPAARRRRRSCSRGRTTPAVARRDERGRRRLRQGAAGRRTRRPRTSARGTRRCSRPAGWPTPAPRRRPSGRAAGSSPRWSATSPTSSGTRPPCAGRRTSTRASSTSGSAARPSGRPGRRPSPSGETLALLSERLRIRRDRVRVARRHRRLPRWPLPRTTSCPHPSRTPSPGSSPGSAPTGARAPTPRSSRSPASPATSAVGWSPSCSPPATGCGRSPGTPTGCADGPGTRDVEVAAADAADLDADPRGARGHRSRVLPDPLARLRAQLRVDRTGAPR